MDESPSNEVKKAIEQVGNKFQNDPLKFTVEPSLQFEILSELRNNSDIKVCGRYLDLEKVDKVNEYKKGYYQKLCQLTEINPVQPEVNSGVSSNFDIQEEDERDLLLIESNKEDREYKNVNVDIAILKEGKHPLFDNDDMQEPVNHSKGGEDIQVVFSEGSKYFPPGALSCAIEIKYIKDKSTVGSGLEAYADKGEKNPEKVEVVDEWDDIEGDIKKLKRLSQNHGVETHLVIFSNFNIFRTNPATSCDKNKREKDDGKYGRKRLEGLRNICRELGIHLWEYHPNPDKE